MWGFGVEGGTMEEAGRGGARGGALLAGGAGAEPIVVIVPESGWRTRTWCRRRRVQLGGVHAGGLR
ncbi:MAG: hypothetical protein R3B49_10450 [Phycisphaerales bacterium]